MIFNQPQTPRAIKVPFNWAADYFDGNSLTEYELSNHKANSFYSIKQNETLRFGLFGNNMKFYLDTTDGHFHLNGRRVDITYIDNDNNEYNLTNNQKNNKRLITYKQAYTNFNQNEIIQETNIESINFGYKTKYKKNKTHLFFQPIVCLPFGKSAYMEVNLTSSRELEGELVFYISGRERERFFAPLKANITGRMNWTIK